MLLCDHTKNRSLPVALGTIGRWTNGVPRSAPNRFRSASESTNSFPGVTGLFFRNFGNGDGVALHVTSDLDHLAGTLLKIGKRLIVNLIHGAATDEDIFASAFDTTQGTVAIRLAMLAGHFAVTSTARAI